MNDLKDFSKTTTIDTAFTLLPIFTCSNKTTDIIIDKKINGIDFKFTGKSLNMGIDLKVFAALFKQEKEYLETSLNSFLYACGYNTKEIRKENKELVIESLTRLKQANITIKRENHILMFGFINRIETDGINIKIDLSKDLVNYFRKKDHKTFLDVKKLDDKWGKKMYHKKLDLFFKNFSTFHHNCKFTEENIFLNLGMEYNAKNRFELKKIIEDFILIGDVLSYKIENGTVFITFKNSKFNLKNKKKIEPEI
jgi:hypothetical protein